MAAVRSKEEEEQIRRYEESDSDEDVEDVLDLPPREPWLIEQVAQGGLLLLLAAATSPISQFTLAPVYGAIPSAVNHSIAIIVTFLGGFWLHYACTTTSEARQGWIVANVREYLTVWPFWVPVVQSVIGPYTSYLGPILGPIINGLFSCHAILLPSAYAIADIYQNMKIGKRGDLLKTGITLSCLLAFPFISLDRVTTTWLRKLLNKYKSITPVHLQLALATSYFLTFISWTPIFSLTVPAILHTLFFNQHWTNAMVNDHLEPYNWTLIDRQWSNTGYISVLESSVEQYRVMRADHSLLGGEFYLTKERILNENWEVNEPIYAVFEMLEAIRLIETSPEIRDDKARALVIGLGIGTAPKSLIAHGIETTVLELDPVVHDFATRYFSFPANHTSIITDAVAWVNSTATTTDPPRPDRQYDYILHDVFTGGAEPLALFTAPFLTNLRRLLRPHGLLALNYAGDLASPLTRRVLHTIATVFGGGGGGSPGSGPCKIFRDSPRPAPHQLPNEPDFVNLVVFCRNDAARSGGGGGPITFRAPRERDLLRSRSRGHYMLPRAELEVAFPADGPGEEGVLLLLGEADVAGYAGEQAESAIRHWRIMRGVVPDAVWELW